MIQTTFSHIAMATVRLWTCDQDGCQGVHRQSVSKHDSHMSGSICPPGWLWEWNKRTLCPSCATIERLAVALV